ncbi:dihydropteroate synthase [Actinotalea fermentans ATCC 43279 = JCM 9966 = DSM 3133]|uniref:Dihydropteroate synthase n=2 Tax=Actinotalea fermentans TaxID=43671 RepID=A0A511YXU5_9CELL|nr:dihydropteroate synthase [Actinotalea fermentans ATCC 43279 = JCM 9966 = DSM 3133]GEN80017.1 dihydropteroate synthase [Actinotalea fermentans]
MRHPAPLPANLTGLDRTLVMGVVNVTPDSFSDGGRWFDRDRAIAHGLELRAQGADLLDVGGESTRPGAPRVDEDEERRRVLPVVHALAAEGAVVSVDTTRPGVARAAVEAGASVVNDVSGGLADAGMRSVVAETGVVYVAMHWRGHADVMDALADYDDVVTDVRDELARRLDELLAAGVRLDQVVLDPGLGFAKPGRDNWPLLANLDVLAGLGRPLLVGASRKRFLGHLLAGPDGEPAPPDARDLATAAVSALCAAAGAWCVRVHDVPGSADAVRVGAAWLAARRDRPDDAPHDDGHSDGHDDEHGDRNDEQHDEGQGGRRG